MDLLSKKDLENLNKFVISSGGKGIEGMEERDLEIAWKSFQIHIKSGGTKKFEELSDTTEYLKGEGFYSEDKNHTLSVVSNTCHTDRILNSKRLAVIAEVVLDLAGMMSKYEVGKSTIPEVIQGYRGSEEDFLINIAYFLERVPVELQTVFVNILGDIYDQENCVLRTSYFLNFGRKFKKSYMEYWRG